MRFYTLNERANNIYKSLNSVYRGKLKLIIYDTCLILAKIDKRLSDLKYIDDIDVAFPGKKIPFCILKAIRRMRPDLHLKFNHRIRHMQIIRIAYFLAESDNFKKGKLDYWLQAEQIRKFTYGW